MATRNRKPRTIRLSCDVTVKDILCTAIREYAYAVYPVGGSECAQTARYTLLELASDIDAAITGDSETAEISRRPKAMVRAALEYYFDRADAAQGSVSVQQRILFDNLLQEQPVTHTQLEAARAADGCS